MTKTNMNLLLVLALFVSLCAMSGVLGQSGDDNAVPASGMVGGDGAPPASEQVEGGAVGTTLGGDDEEDGNQAIGGVAGDTSNQETGVEQSQFAAATNDGGEPSEPAAFGEETTLGDGGFGDDTAAVQDPTELREETAEEPPVIPPRSPLRLEIPKESAHTVAKSPASPNVDHMADGKHADGLGYDPAKHPVPTSAERKKLVEKGHRKVGHALTAAEKHKKEQEAKNHAAKTSTSPHTAPKLPHNTTTNGGASGGHHAGGTHPPTGTTNHQQGTAATPAKTPDHKTPVSSQTHHTGATTNGTGGHGTAASSPHGSRSASPAGSQHSSQHGSQHGSPAGTKASTPAGSPKHQKAPHS